MLAGLALALVDLAIVYADARAAQHVAHVAALQGSLAARADAPAVAGTRARGAFVARGGAVEDLEVDARLVDEPALGETLLQVEASVRSRPVIGLLPLPTRVRGATTMVVLDPARTW